MQVLGVFPAPFLRHLQSLGYRFVVFICRYGVCKYLESNPTFLE